MTVVERQRAYTRKSTETHTFTQPSVAGFIVPLNQTVIDRNLTVVHLKYTDVFHSLSTIAEKVILFRCRCYSREYTIRDVEKIKHATYID